MSDADTATLPADMTAPISGIEKDLAGAVSGVKSAQKDEAAATTEANKALEDKKKGIEKERADLQKWSQDNPFPQPDVKPWTAKPPENNPIERFGSWASAFGVVAGLLTKTPLASSLNASAAAMNAMRKNDLDSYDQAHQAWKENTELAVKQADWEAKKYEAAFDVMKTDQALGASQLEIAAAQAGNDMVLAKLKEGNYKDIWDMTAAMKKFALEGPEVQQKLGLIADQNRVLMQLNNNSAKELGVPVDKLPADVKLKNRQEAMKPISPKASPEDLKWEVLTDPTNNTQYRYNPVYGVSTTLDGKPYTPGGAAKLGPATNSSPDSPEVVESRAAQIATGQPQNQVVPGLSGSGDVGKKRQEAYEGAIKLIMKQEGVDAPKAGVILARRSIEYSAGKVSETQLDSMKGATIAAVKQLDFNVDRATEEMDKLGSSDLAPVINAIARGEEKWTGDPAYYGLFFYMQAAATESARILSGGQASRAQLNEGARKEAQQWANANMTPQSWKEGVAPAMKAEGEQRIKTFDEAMKEQQVGGNDKKSPPDHPPLPPGVPSDAQWSPSQKKFWWKENGEWKSRDAQ